MIIDSYRIDKENKMDIQTTSSLTQQSSSKLKNDENSNSVSDFYQIKSDSKKQLNAAILESTISFNAALGDPQALVLKTALEGINDALQGTLGDNAIQASYDAGIDVSPEATADRIVSMSTAFFSAYQNNHPELSQEEAVTNFTAIISGGIDQGFSEAREILSGLDVLNGDIASNIDRTYTLVQEKLDLFVNSFQSDAE
ncbi:MAG: hypothetical protein COA90_08770 [Gammaproteobacteria bacterium]|nr:MAG: hypothetical protein COA90_08770 [Gammaproteobacteria bacterium]